MCLYIYIYIYTHIYIYMLYIYSVSSSFLPALRQVLASFLPGSRQEKKHCYLLKLPGNWPSQLMKKHSQ